MLGRNVKFLGQPHCQTFDSDVIAFEVDTLLLQEEQKWLNQVLLIVEVIVVHF